MEQNQETQININDVLAILGRKTVEAEIANAQLADARKQIKELEKLLVANKEEDKKDEKVETPGKYDEPELKYAKAFGN